MKTTPKQWLALAVGAIALTACGHAAAPRALANPIVDPNWHAFSITPPDPDEILSPNFNDRNGTPISVIVLHHTAVLADALSTANFFKDPASKVSSHYIVDRSGLVIRSVPDDKRAWHAGRSQFNGVPDVNTFSIGIEISNVGDGVEPYPAAQVDAVVKLVAWLASTYKIPMSNLTRHRDICLPVGRKQDTSNNFDEAYVAQAAQALIDGSTVPAYHAKSAPPHYDPSKQTYVVKKGDTLSSISELIFDTPAMAMTIVRVNPGVVLRPGAVLKIPTSYDP